MNDSRTDKEPECPSCGRELLFFQDPLGSGFNCHARDCMETWDYDEIVEPEPVQVPPKDPDAEMWNNIAIVAAS